MHSVALTVDQLSGKQRGGKLLGEAIKSGFQIIGLYVKKVVGVTKSGKGVMAAAVAFYELLIFTGLWIFFRAQKQHVFKKVRNTLSLSRVITAADSHIHRGGGFLCMFVGNQNGSQTVTQLNETVFVVVIGALVGGCFCQ